MKRKPTTKKIDGDRITTNEIWHSDAEAPPDSVFSKTDKLTTKLLMLMNRNRDLIDEGDEIMQDAIAHAYHVGIARGRALATKSGEKRKAK